MSRLPTGGNLVKNGNFALKPPFVAAQTGNGLIDGTAAGSSALLSAYGWHAAGSGTRTVEFAELDGYDCLKIAVTANSSYAEVRSNSATTYNEAKGFIVKPSTAYQFKFDLKTTDMTGDATNGIFGLVLMSQASGAAGTTSNSTSAVKTNQDWTTYTIDFTTGASDRFGHAELRFYGHQGAGTLKGNAYFKNVRVEEVGVTRQARVVQVVNPNLVLNGSFRKIPPANTPTTGSPAWIDGTASGSTALKAYGWATVAGAVSNADALIDNTVFYSDDTASLRLRTLTTAGSITVGTYQSLIRNNASTDLFLLEPNTAYRLTGKIKTSTVAANGAFLDLRQFTGSTSPSAITTNSTNKISGTQDWTSVELTVTTQASAYYGCLFARLNVTGNVSTAWYGRIRLEKLTPVTRQAI